MKNNSVFIYLASMVFSIMVFPLHAAHLDGLWRSHRENITIRIEQDQDGFRAKRIDQGIWYRYVAQNDQVFVDRRGNRYEIEDDDEMMWYDAHTTKRLAFTKVQDGNDRRYDHDNDPWNNDDNQDDWYDNDNRRDRDWRDNDNGRFLDINGHWLDRFNGRIIEIKSFNGGYLIIDQRGGYDKYYADRSGYRFKDRQGNIFQIMDANSLKWRSAQGRDQSVFTRQHVNSRGKNNHGHGKDNCG